MTPNRLNLTPPDWPITDDAIREVFDAMLRDGSWGRYHGPHCDALRTALADYHRAEFVTLCSSGTSAIELALRAVGVSPGDEVILAAYDYKANFANVLITGAVPVLIDTLPGLPVMDPDELPAAISERTKAIVCSHLHGSLARLSDVMNVASEHGIPVIEDACQAAGATLDGHRAGSVGDIGVLSFGGSKLLTSGRGGAIVTGNATYAQRIRLYTQRGNDAYPLSEMQAAVLLPQLRQLDERNATRLRHVRRLLSLLDDVNEPAAFCRAAIDPDPATTSNMPAFYKLALLHNHPEIDRDDISRRCRSQGIAIDAGFPALNLTHSKSRFRAVGDLKNAAALHSGLLTLHHPVLLQDDAPEQIVSALKMAYAVS
ncbi:MAG: aminotransferase class V-fold PLP-dependent enzyme [Planctomycetaceae bacterium]